MRPRRRLLLWYGTHAIAYHRLQPMTMANGVCGNVVKIIVITPETADAVSDRLSQMLVSSPPRVKCVSAVCRGFYFKSIKNGVR